MNNPGQRKVKVALIGCGAVSQKYYGPALRLLEKRGAIEVTTLLDPHLESLARLQKLFPGAGTADSVTSMGQGRAELAVVASPPQCHALQTVEALRAGLGVLCEKPMASTTNECRAMIEAAAAAKGVLAIGLVRRFFPATQFIREVLDNNWLGKVTSFRCFEGGKFEWPVQSARYFSDAPGGVLLDVGIHTLDLLLWWFGEPEEIVYQDDALDGIEVNCRIDLRFRTGIIGQVRLTRDWPRPNHFTIWGSKGWLRWEVNEANAVQLGLNDSPYGVNGGMYILRRGDDSSPKQPAPDFHQSFVEQLHNVAAAVQGREPVRVSGATGLRGMELVEYCYRHRTLMHMPWLSESESICANRLAKGAP